MKPKRPHMRALPWIAAATNLALASGANATLISPVTSAGQAIGAVVAGMSYTVTASGTIDECSTCNAGGPLVFNPDGNVATTAQAPYEALNSGPQDMDPSNGEYGVYGAGINYGELYGSFSATPTAADLFAIGYGATFTATTTGTLYGVINDDNYGDNPATPDYSVTLGNSVSAAPEPASWALMIAGVGMVGLASRHGKHRHVSDLTA